MASQVLVARETYQTTKAFNAISMFDLVVSGHTTMDFIKSERVKCSRWTPGGAAVYASLAAASLGASVSLMSKVGSDFPEEWITWMAKLGVDTNGIRRVGAPTTRFVLDYLDNERSICLKALCEPILLGDLPADTQFRAVHIGSVAGEISFDTAIEISKRAELVSLDPQGFVRRFDERGYAHLEKWFDRRLLGRTHVFKASAEELEVVAGTSKVKEALVKINETGPHIAMATMGWKGAVIFTVEDGCYLVPAHEPSRLVDLTGAGDAFIGAFLAEYLRTKDPLWSAAIGSSSSSFVIEGVGPTRFGARDEVIGRARDVFKRIRRI